MSVALAGLIFFLAVAGLYLLFTIRVGWGLFVMRFTKVETLATKQKFLDRIKQTEDWIEEHGMTFAGFFETTTPIAAWYLADRSLILFGNIRVFNHDMVLQTRFPDDVTLVTSNIKDFVTAPSLPHGTYMQIFPKMTLEELWERHCEAERYLAEQCGVVFTPRLPDIDWPEADDIHHSQQIPNVALHSEMIDRVKTNPFAVLYDGDDDDTNPQNDSDSFSQAGVRLIQQNLQRSFRAQSRYMIGLFQWRWLLNWYWFFIGYRRIRNQTVEQLITKAWYKHPQTLPPNYRKWYK